MPSCQVRGQNHAKMVGCIMILMGSYTQETYLCKLSLLVTVLCVEGALVVVGVDAGELDLVAGLADVAEVAEQDGVFGAGKPAGGNLLSQINVRG